MTRYRFVTPHRTGKWYPDLITAQQHACAIGAGFFDTRSGRFYAYPGTALETRQEKAESLLAACRRKAASQPAMARHWLAERRQKDAGLPGLAGGS